MFQELSLQLVFLDGEEAIEEWTATDSIYGARELARKWHSDKLIEADGRWHGANVLDQIVRFDKMNYVEA